MAAASAAPGRTKDVRPVKRVVCGVLRRHHRN
jgi:hypothetical protein